MQGESNHILFVALVNNGMLSYATGLNGVGMNMILFDEISSKSCCNWSTDLL